MDYHTASQADAAIHMASVRLIVLALLSGTGALVAGVWIRARKKNGKRGE